jgi:molybdopterin converting factor small subunit
MDVPNHVRVRYFAALRESRGTNEEVIALAEPMSARALYDRLFPKAGGGQIPVGFAVNGEQVPGSHLLVGGEEVIFLPPLGGG